MGKVYNKETGALFFDGAADQAPSRLQIGDQISFVEDVCVVEDIRADGGDLAMFVGHMKM
jgi:hypothetical protein